ncbi:MAG: hypothetical protein V3W37_07715 [Candidatus Binatia bacterium]
MTEPTMTPEERARAVLARLKQEHGKKTMVHVTTVDRNFVVMLIAKQIHEAERAAADREREGCAKTALKYMCTYPMGARLDICSLAHVAAGVAKAIRARKEEGR